MATCKKDCIHYSVCGIWDRKIFIDYDNNILSDFSDLPNVEEYCKNYLSNEIVPRLHAYENITRLCSKCKKEVNNMNEINWMQQGWECPKCGAVMSPHTACCVNCRGNSGSGVATTIPSSVEEIDMRDLIINPLKYYDTIHQVETVPEAYYTDITLSSSSSSTTDSTITAI